MKNRIRRRRGFTLVETLIVLMILGVMTGAVGLSTGGRSEQYMVRQEAESLAHWLSNRMTRARLEGVGFQLIASVVSDAKNLELMLLRADQRKGEVPEKYRAQSAIIEKAINLQRHTYNSTWHTLTPAMTLTVRSRKKHGDIVYLVTVSGYGLVSVTPKVMYAGS